MFWIALIIGIVIGQVLAMLLMGVLMAGRSDHAVISGVSVPELRWSARGVADAGVDLHSDVLIVPNITAWQRSTV